MPRRPSRLFSWLAEWCAEELLGTLHAIFVAEQAGGAMRSITQVEAVAGRGLAGDRYANGQGHWRHTDACEVTLVTAEDLDRAAAKSDLSFAAGEHRRNLVISGVPLEAFRGRQVRIGQALFGYHRLRPPCGYLDRLVQRGAGKALGRGAGIGLRVLEGGRISVGDRVTILPQRADGTRSHRPGGL